MSTGCHLPWMQMARDAGLLGALNNSDQIMTRTTWKASLPLACSYSDGSCGAFMRPTSNTRGNPSLEDNRSRDPGRKPLRVTLFHLEMPTAPNSHIASRWRHAFHRGRRQHAFLIAPAAPSVPHTPRLRALVHFGRRPTRRGDGLVIAGIRNASQQETRASQRPRGDTGENISQPSLRIDAIHFRRR